MAVQVEITVGGTDYGFDPITQEIEIDALTDGINADDLKQAIRSAEASQELIVFDDICATGNPITLDPDENVATAQNIILLGMWRILSLKTSGSFVVGGGNTVRIDTGVDVFAVNPVVNNSNIVSAAATRLLTGSGVTEQDKLDIKELVFGEIMEGAETFREAMRLIRAEAAGDIVRAGTLHRIKAADGIQDRIVATADENGRDVTTTDAS